MDKPTVYIETTVAGHLTSRLPKLFDVAAQMLATREWWEKDRPHFDCYTSPVVLDEAGCGDAVTAAERLEKLASLPLVFGSQQVDALADLLCLAPRCQPRRASMRSTWPSRRSTG